MKYLIASSGDNLDARVAGRFGHADYFIIFDTDTEEYEVIPGVGPDEPAHGISRFKDRHIGRVIVGNIGPGAFEDATSMGWTIYLCRGMSVKDAVEKVENGEISPLDKPTVKKSIHSARSAHGDEDDLGDGHRRGEHRGPGRGSGHGLGRGRGMGAGRGRHRVD